MTYIKDIKHSVQNLNPKTMLYDAVSFILFYASYFLWSLYTLNIVDKVEALNIPEDLSLVSPEQAETIYNAMQMYLWKAGIAAALLFIACVLIFSLAKYLIWSDIQKKTLSLKAFLKFMLLASIYSVLSIALLYFLFSGLGLLDYLAYSGTQGIVLVKSLLYLVIAILTFFGTMLFMNFSDSPKLKSVKTAFVSPLKKLKFYMIPFATLFIPLFVMWELSMLIPNFMLVFCILLIAWMAWSRSYLLYITDNVEAE